MVFFLANHFALFSIVRKRSGARGKGGKETTTDIVVTKAFWTSLPALFVLACRYADAKGVFSFCLSYVYLEHRPRGFVSFDQTSIMPACVEGLPYGVV